MDKRFKKVLVLNADYTPWAVKSWKKALVDVIVAEYVHELGAMVVEYYDHPDAFVKSGGGQIFQIPAVIALNQYIHNKNRKAPFTRKNVFLRDNMTCQYCGFKTMDVSELTFDHIISRNEWAKKNMKGSPTNWTNIITACGPCNTKKGNKSLKESGMKLLKAPAAPSSINYIPGLNIFSKIPKQWVPYLSSIYKDTSIFRTYN